MIYSRETTVGLIAALLITFTAWAWGGVVLWTQWVTAGFGLFALAVALLPSTQTKWQSRTVRYRIALAIAGGLGVLIFSLVRRLLEISESREATLQLIPNAELPPLAFSDWGETPLLIGLGTTLFLALLTGLLRPSGASRRLFRFWPFWLGLFLFAWITCQSLNPWGKVIQRDLFWHIIPQDYITWLPSGLDAPFASTEEPGGMNGWRQLLILIGPWALLCALHISIQHRRIFAWLAIAACISGLGLVLVGNIYQSNKWTSFLGVDDPDLRASPFGPFIYANQAGAFLYLTSALAIALAFYLAKRQGDKVDRGGPYLVVSLAAVFLAMGAASTMSIAAASIAVVLLFIVAPLAFFADRQLRLNLSPIPAITVVILGGIVLYAGVMSTDARVWRYRINQKQKMLALEGTDDRAPLRRATWMMVEDANFIRQLSGWGAGSYRWISPGYLSGQQEFTNKDGVLVRRVTHAHNDWLQVIAELGIAGWMIVIAAIAFLFWCIYSQISNPIAPSLVLIGGLLLFAGHAFLDFLLFSPQMTIAAVIFAWLLMMPSSEKTRTNL